MSKIGGDALTDGASVNQWELTGNDTQKWIFTHDGYGYYTIHQVNGSQLLCMNVENNSTALNEDIVLSYEGFSLSDQAPLWQISVTPSGAFKLTAKQSESLGYVLATSTSSQTNGARLIQGAYSSDTNYCDEWVIAYADALKPQHIPSLTFTLQYVGETTTNSTWQPLIIAAVNSWNNSAVNTNISLSTSTSNYTITVDSYPDVDWRGRMSTIEKNGVIITKGAIQINTLKISTIDITAQSTITHEIGHLLGLSDNPPVVNYNDTLMSHDRNRRIVYIPQGFDEYNVKFVYDID